MPTEGILSQIQRKVHFYGNYKVLALRFRPQTILQCIVDKIGFFIICSLYFQQENKEIQVTPKYYAHICTHEPLQYSKRSEENFNGLQMVTLLFRVAVLFIHEYVFIFMHFTSATCLTYCHKDIMHFFFNFSCTILNPNVSFRFEF